MTATALSPKLYFSYSQFMVFDKTEQLPGCDWTEEHTSQGFARRESTVCFGTPLEFGYADVTIVIGPYKAREDYGRVISVPFLSSSGKATVEGPDEMDVDRVFDLPRGNYRLTAAQIIIGDDEELIDLFFEPLEAPLKQSTILIADEMLNPPKQLTEMAGIAGA
jgi:hypothetical protein